MAMQKYEVIQQCSVPVGPGLKHKRPGQIVTLKAADAKKLGDSVKKLGDDEGGHKVTPPADKPEPKSAPVLETETVREVYPDAGDPSSGDE